MPLTFNYLCHMYIYMSYFQSNLLSQPFFYSCPGVDPEVLFSCLRINLLSVFCILSPSPSSEASLLASSVFFSFPVGFIPTVFKHALTSGIFKKILSRLLVLLYLLLGLPLFTSWVSWKNCLFVVSTILTFCSFFNSLQWSFHPWDCFCQSLITSMFALRGGTIFSLNCN